MFDAVVALMLVVDYLRPVQFRDPRRPIILVPYLAPFFTRIFLMGIATLGVNRSLCLVTVATSAALISRMMWACAKGRLETSTPRARGRESKAGQPEQARPPSSDERGDVLVRPRHTSSRPHP